MDSHRYRSKLGRTARSSALFVTLALVASACGSDGEEVGQVSVTSTSPATTAETEPPTTEAEAQATAETSNPPTTAAATTSEAPHPVPGEPLDFGPQAGVPLRVIGVKYDDVLNFRADPSPAAEILATGEPLAPDFDLSTMGEAWNAPGGAWWKVKVLGAEAWANQKFLGMIGDRADVFDEVGADLGVLKFESVESAALAVAATRSSEAPPSDVVLVGEPHTVESGIGSAVVDVVGLGDDAVKGLRMWIDVDVVFEADSTEDVQFVVLTGVEAAPICSRGLSGGLCL